MIRDATQLVGKSGDLVALVGVSRGPDGWADLGQLDWTGGGVALTNLTVDKVRLVTSVMNPRFVDSRIRHSQFEGMVTNCGLFGTRDEWTSSMFKDAHFHDPVMPLSRFRDCAFKRVQFDGLSPHDTVFEDCRFESVTFTGLKCLPIARKPVNPEFCILGESLLFKNCEFASHEFAGCDFRNVRFVGCTFVDPRIDECDFTGIKSDTQWWGASPSADPFIAYLREAIKVAVARLGPSCRAGHVMAQFLHEFQNGVANKDEYVDRLYDGSIPDYELDQIEDDLTTLEGKYSL